MADRVVMRDSTLSDRSRAEAWGFYVLVLMLVGLPLPFGGYYQWSWAGLAIIVSPLMLISKPSYQLRLWELKPELNFLKLPCLLYLLVAAWIAIQASSLTPDSWDHPMWSKIAGMSGANVTGAISLDIFRTWSECLKMLTFGGIFFLATVYCRDRRRALIALRIIGIAGTFYALYGLIAQFTEVGSTLFFHPMPTGESGVRSTFVNRNLYANYAAFGFLTLVVISLDKLAESARLNRSSMVLWKRIVRGHDSVILLLASCALVTISALFMTVSRGGISAAMVAFVCLLICFNLRSNSSSLSGRAMARITYAILALGIVSYVIVGGGLGSRLSTSPSAETDGRLQGYELIIRAISDSPLTGHGAGTVLDVFYLYNDGRFWNSFNYAHNHYLGLAVEIGLPATVILMIAIGMIGLVCLKGVRRRRRDKFFPALGVSVLVLVALHGLVDSPLILPANAATFSFLLGLAYAQSWSTQMNKQNASAPGA